MSQATFWKERDGPLTVWAVELAYSSLHRNRVESSENYRKQGEQERPPGPQWALSTAT